MKAYGKERGNHNVDDDVLGCRVGAPKSSVRNVQGRGGDIHNSLRSVGNKRRTRKAHKGSARMKGKKIVRDEQE